MQTNINTQNTDTKLHPVVLKILEKRGFNNKNLNQYFSIDLKNIPDLTQLKDLEKASGRIIEAIEKNQKIGIFGDYDVDGTTSCAVFYHFFQMLGIEIELMQPSRFIEGYGIHPPSVNTAKEKGIEVLITVDCGITNNEAADYAKKIGMDLIITDHHSDINEVIPDAFAVVNPNRRDEPKDSPLRKLAGCSIAFITCLKVRELLIAKGQDCPSIYPLLQFVAIGTICDLVPLIPLNLKLVRHGLKQIPATEYSGIKAFFTPEERKFPVPSEKLGFHIGPLINSKGRLDHPEMSLNLLISKNQDDAYKYYSHLEFCNKERKFITKEVFEKAEKEVLKSLGSNEHLISLVYSPDWHEGVVGIVASRLVDAFKVPAIVFTDSEEKGIIKGSARSAGDLNLFNLLNDEKELFLKFGGHKAAAGLSLKKENLPLLRERLNKKLKEMPFIERTLTDHYDLEISAFDISPKLLRDLSLMEPFGNNNEKPVFKMTDSTLESFDLMKEVHVRWNLCSKDGKRRSRGISFNYVGKWGLLHPQEIFNAVKAGDDMSVYFTLGLNRFNGNEYIQLHIQKIELGSI